MRAGSLDAGKRGVTARTQTGAAGKRVCVREERTNTDPLSSNQLLTHELRSDRLPLSITQQTGHVLARLLLM